MAFTFKDYQENERIKELRNKLNNVENAKPDYSESKWSEQANDTLNQIANRDDFKYSINNDALYQQYKQQYMNQGKQAMKDTIGQASALTGGYGNSYANTVGQQTYNEYMQRLNDKIPELYQLALDKYNQDTANLYNLYGIYSDKDNQDYSRYKDKLSDYYTERELLGNQLSNERNFDYGKYSDNRAFGYNQYRDDVADAVDDRNFNEGVRQFDKNNELAWANHNLNKSNSAAELAYKYAALNKSSGSTGRTTTKKADESKKVSAEAENNVTALYQTPTDAMKNFSNSIMTRTEFARHGNSTTVNGVKVSNYSDYIKNSLLKWVDDGSLTEEEGDALANIYMNREDIK